jgi:hypothetical protein
MLVLLGDVDDEHVAPLEASGVSVAAIDATRGGPSASTAPGALPGAASTHHVHDVVRRARRLG